jgi:polyisoprenoid-binding protein YceI
VADITGTFLLGPDSGRVLLKTGRAGLAARAGHDLTIEITRWSARVTVPSDGASAAQISAELDLGSLAVREGTGGAKPLTDKDRRDIAGTARKILGQGPASFASTRVIPSGGAAETASSGAIEGTLTLNGRSAPLRLQVTSPGPGRYRGGATVKQTDFGITPYTGFFGALKLRDEIGVEVEANLDRADTE